MVFVLLVVLLQTAARWPTRLHAQIAVRLCATTSAQIGDQHQSDKGGQRTANGDRHNVRRVHRVAVAGRREVVVVRAMECLQLQARNVQVADDGCVIGTAGGKVQLLDACAVVRGVRVRLEMRNLVGQLDGLVGCVRANITEIC